MLDLASISSAFCNVKHNTSPAIDRDAFASIPKALISHPPSNIATLVTTVAEVQHRRSGRPPSNKASNVPPTHTPAKTPFL